MAQVYKTSIQELNLDDVWLGRAPSNLEDGSIKDRLPFVARGLISRSTPPRNSSTSSANTLKPTVEGSISVLGADFGSGSGCSRERSHW